MSADNSVRCWGNDNNGQLGDGTTTSQTSPIPIPALNGVVDIVLGDRHGCARSSANVVSCWGANEAAQLGDGTTTERHAPVVALTSVTGGFVLGWDHSIAVVQGGSFSGWGSNRYGELGDGTSTAHFSPSPSPDLPGLAKLGVSTSSCQTCAVMTDGSVKCWGRHIDNGRPTPAPVVW
jgi:alpha-tubulin suppressor-like RCC1 family protein